MVASMDHEKLDSHQLRVSCTRVLDDGNNILLAKFCKVAYDEYCKFVFVFAASKFLY